MQFLRDKPGPADLLPGLSQLGAVLALDVLEHKVLGHKHLGAQCATPPAEPVGHSRPENAAAWSPVELHTHAAIQPAHNMQKRQRPGRWLLEQTKQGQRSLGVLVLDHLLLHPFVQLLLNLQDQHACQVLSSRY